MKKRTTKEMIEDTRDAVNIAIPGMLPFIQYCIDPFLKNYPFWGLAIYSVIGLYGVYLALKQDTLNELINYISEHPKEFRKEIVESEEFRLGFIRFFDSYIKERLENKRRILRAILLGFATSTDKENFDLERLQDTLVRISPNGLEQLIFIKNEIVPILKPKVDKNISQVKVPQDHEKLTDFYWSLQSISKEVLYWAHMNYPKESLNIELKSTPSKYPGITGTAMIVNAGNEDFNLKKESWPELQSLGIFTVQVLTDEHKRNANSYHFTKFGRQFLIYISEKDI